MFCCYFDSLEGNAWDEADPTWERGSKNMKYHSMMSTMDNIRKVNFSDMTMIDSNTCKGIQHRLVYHQFLLGEKWIFSSISPCQNKVSWGQCCPKGSSNYQLVPFGPCGILGGK